MWRPEPAGRGLRNLYIDYSASVTHRFVKNSRMSKDKLLDITEFSRVADFKVNIVFKQSNGFL